MIAVLVETDADGVLVVSQEALTFGRGLAERAGGVPLHAVAVGRPGEEPPAVVLAQLGEQGVASVHHVVDDRLTAYSAAAWAAALVDVAHSAGAAVVLAAGTPRGNEVLAHTATRLDVAMAANVVGIDAVGADAGDPLIVTRQVVGGAVLEQMQLGDTVAVLSVAGHAVEPAAAATATTPEVVEFSPTLTDADLVARVVRTGEKVSDASGALTSARVVVGAGRGAGSADGFKDVVRLSELLGGAVGVSRVVTSLGWRPHHEQVGQTGSRISPDLYIACGISGAIQHWAGCSSAKTILAVNTDPDAPMVTRAHYAVIGDLHEIVPAINDELDARRT
ncbi:MAG: electron transfer flavoprotein subunit alpha/FixB family protein [Actinomycetota bacterium]|nr:electron transfer flavoprotein subunit alpha/FixB family protein [Actinomycetota bacterium]